MTSSEKVQVFSAEGKFLRQIARGQWRDPCGIAFATNGDAYIADFVAHRVVVCRPDGSVVRRIGSEGKGDGQFKNPFYVAIDRRQVVLFVVDAMNNRVQVLTLDGTFVRAFGTKAVAMDSSMGLKPLP